MKDFNEHESKWIIPDTLYTFNANNVDDFSFRTEEGYRKSKDTDIIFDRLKNTNWKSESDYYNYNRHEGLKSKNFDTAIKNCLIKRSKEPSDTIANPHVKNAADWKLSKSGKEYYKKEIKKTKILTSKEDPGRRDTR